MHTYVHAILENITKKRVNYYCTSGAVQVKCMDKSTEKCEAHKWQTKSISVLVNPNI